MADIIPDFDFNFSDVQQDPQEGTFDDLFADVNFSEDIDPGFEARLAEDYPVEEELAPTSPPQPEAPILFEPNPQPSDEIYSQQEQFVNPQQIFGAPQPAYAPSDLINANDLKIDWPLGQEHLDIKLAQDLNEMLAKDPIFISQPLNTQVYSDYFPMDNQVNSQPLIQAQPVANQINDQQMLHQQPMDLGYQVTWPLQNEPIPQAIPQPPVDPGADSFIPLQLRSSRNSRELPSAGTKTTSPPLKRPAKNHNGEVLLNDRIPRKTHRGKGPAGVEPERYYGPSPPKPRDWGPRDARGRYLFTYTEKGELAAGLFLTAREMRLYLLGPSPQDRDRDALAGNNNYNNNNTNFAGPFRLPGVKLRTKKKRQGLTLWVGWPAAMCNARYPRGGESTKCRFKNCPYRQRTISLGDPWVILDERQNADGELVDPFHNAGYVHLFCLESNFDIVDLWQCLDIRPDYRSFKRESHPYFCLAYKLPNIDAVVKDWWHAAFRNWELARSHGMKRIRTHESSLAQCLVNHKLAHEPQTQIKSRLKRGGADIFKHRGNPEVKKRLVTFRRHKLLDDNGWPVPGADELLDEMENSKRNKRRGDKSNPIIHIGMEPVNAMQPVYNTDPVYSIANPVHLNQPIPTDPYTLQAPNAPVAMGGHKRTWDDAILEVLMDTTMPNQAASEPPTIINQETPFPKRQRLDDITPAYSQPVTETLPTLTPTDLPGLSVIDGDAGIEVQGYGLLGYYPENDTPAMWDFNNVDNDLADLNQELGDGVLDSFFGDPVAEMALDNGSGTAQAKPTQAEPAPTPPHEARANQSDSNGDSCGGLFGKPGEYQETPSSLSGSPKAGGFLSPVKADSPCVTNEIQTEK
ncbi:hypothetical protein F5B21DRAFT_518287 [Xylaria acuta]|nr:hypothetical protein F5B21DRAFT_518287 [Xylaria acuta]